MYFRTFTVFVLSYFFVLERVELINAHFWLCFVGSALFIVLKVRCKQK